ncbi:MAG: aminotransferase [Candidatus Sericytochromatia bacterium]|nr:MAG: aminotransferase [Candidatus Sericytochromatia bacterium]
MDYKSLKEKRKKYFTHTAIHYYKEPLYITKASGTKVWDSDGKEYLDAICGIVSISVGHNHPKIKEKLIERFQNDGIQHSSVLYMTEPAIELAEKLVSLAPEGLNRVFFTNSGSEANEYAIMAARNFTGEEIVVSLKHGYHGGTLLAQTLCGHSTWKFRAQPFTSVVHTHPPYCYRCPFDKERNSCGLACAKDLEETILTVTRGKIAALIVEPIMGVGGFIEAPAEFIEEAYRICKKYGGLYISDEVQTGIGRTGETFFYIEKFGVKPDMVTMAKSLGNGAPIAAVMMTDECSEALTGKLHFNTFGADPYQALQAKINLEIIEEENLMENVKVLGNYLKSEFEKLKEKHEILGDVRGKGMMFALELVKDKKTKEHATNEANEMMEETRKRGLLIGKGGLKGNILRMAPAYNITKEECQKIVQIIDEALTEVQKNSK